jgi:hypothetical protein
METQDCTEGFCGIGHWRGVAEVYDGQGQFLGNGADQRHVRTQEEDGRTRIDLAFVGPLKFSGHYYITNKGDHRLYQGPANCGHAEALGSDGVSAHAYWPVTGLSQKFFLMVSPDGLRQMSLALMSRGEQLLYVVVGENAKVVGEKALVDIPLVHGGTYDLKEDPKAGRENLLLHQAGYWEGEIRSQKAGSNLATCNGMRQSIQPLGQNIRFAWDGSTFLKNEVSTTLSTNQWQAWSAEGEFVGSYSLYGGRALAGTFHHLTDDLRVWRREVVSADGAYKALVNLWYRGEERLGAEWGLLKYRAITA